MATIRIDSLNPKSIKAKGESKQKIIMIKGIIRLDTDQIVVIRECHLEVEVGMDRIIEEGLNMLIIIEMTLGEDILGKCKIMEVSIIEVNIEAIIEMTILEEVEIGLERQFSSNFRKNDQSGNRDQDQVQDLVLIEVELDVLNVRNMIFH